MAGFSRHSGRSLSSTDAHIAQSIGDILSTPIGSRLMRRTYGSLLFSLIDQPTNPALAIRLYAAAATAINTWEPRVRITALSLARDANNPAVLTLIINGRRTDTNAVLSVQIPLNSGGSTV